MFAVWEWEWGRRGGVIARAIAPLAAPRREVSRSAGLSLSSRPLRPLSLPRSRACPHRILRARARPARLLTRRLWRGFPLPLITISIVRTISFSIYSATKRILNSEPGTVETSTDASGKAPWINLRLGILNRDSTLDVALTSLLAGAASGAVVCVGSAPFELVKVGKVGRRKEGAQLTKHRSGDSSSTRSTATLIPSYMGPPRAPRRPRSAPRRRRPAPRPRQRPLPRLPPPHPRRRRRPPRPLGGGRSRRPSSRRRRCRRSS